jgi:hypothetical protein
VSDSDFVDVGDELVVRIAGYPVAKATVFKITPEDVWVSVGEPSLMIFNLPLDFKDYDQVDGVAHAPL